MQAFLYRPQTVWPRRLLFQIHLWSGIGAGLYVFLVCVTGAALMFRIDMQRALHPGLFTPMTGTPADPATVLEAVRDAFPADAVSSLEVPSRTRPVYLAYLRRGNDFLAVLVDPVSARVLGEVPQHSAVRTLQELHFNLLGGDTGRKANGVGGALLLLLCVTGMVIWWPGLPNWRRGFLVGWRRNWKRVIWDLHGAVGIWTVLLIAMWAITGFYFAFPSQFRSAVNWMSPLTAAEPPQSAQTVRGTTAVPWRELIARARAERADQHVARIVPPADDTAAFQVLFAESLPLPGGKSELTPVYLDQYSGDILQTPQVERSAGDAIMEWAGWLHTGGFGGNGVRITWFILGFAPALLFATGFTMWWNRVIVPRRAAPVDS
jgi:uncharacterized iron-regulated membrane protein